MVDQALPLQPAPTAWPILFLCVCAQLLGLERDATTSSCFLRSPAQNVVSLWVQMCGGAGARRTTRAGGGHQHAQKKADDSPSTPQYNCTCVSRREAPWAIVAPGRRLTQAARVGSRRPVESSCSPPIRAPSGGALRGGGSMALCFGPRGPRALTQAFFMLSLGRTQSTWHQGWAG
jgi:hypothetical protein